MYNIYIYIYVYMYYIQIYTIYHSNFLLPGNQLSGMLFVIFPWNRSVLWKSGQGREAFAAKCPSKAHGDTKPEGKTGPSTMPLNFNLKNQSLQIHCWFIDFFGPFFFAPKYTFLNKKNMLALLITSLSKWSHRSVLATTISAPFRRSTNEVNTWLWLKNSVEHSGIIQAHFLEKILASSRDIGGKSCLGTVQVDILMVFKKPWWECGSASNLDDSTHTSWTFTILHWKRLNKLCELMRSTVI